MSRSPTDAAGTGMQGWLRIHGRGAKGVRLRRLLLGVVILLVPALSAVAATEDDPDQLLAPESTEAFGRFGQRLSVDGDQMVVGYRTAGPPAPADFDTELVQIYTQDSGQWVANGAIGTTYPGFGGGGLAVDGGWLAIGNQLSDSQCGDVRLFMTGPAGLTFRQTLRTGFCNGFGADLVLDGSLLVVSDSQSRLYLYRLNGVVWTLVETLPDGGRPVDLNGGLLATMSADEATPEDNGVSVYEVSAAGFSAPTLLNPSGDSAVDHCWDAAIGLGRIVIGCPFTTHQPPSLSSGAVFVFERAGGTWVETDVLTPSNGFGDMDQFGSSVDVDGDRILVGAQGWTNSDHSIVGVGGVYLYTHISGSWVNTAFHAGKEAGAAASSSRGSIVDINGGLLIAADPSYARIGAVAIYVAPSGRFQDDEDSVFEASIDWLAAEGITGGCNPPLNTAFCSDRFVTRGEMAAFLVRALGYTDDGGGDVFVDDDDSVFEAAIDRLATAGVTLGCNPPDNDWFCPDQYVTRGQMAAFLVRAFGYTDTGTRDYFVDDDENIFEDAIDKLRVAGVTLGCNPPANDRYCPDDDVTRGQMAAFLKRALTS